MRFLTTSMMALVVAVAITGCSGSSNSADNSATSAAADNGATSTAADNSAAQTSTNSATAAGDIPSYPGAKTEAAAGSAMSGSGMAAGKVLSTSDAFDKVYAWYQKNMPAGSEKSHTDAPVKSAVFFTGEAGKDQQSVTLSTANGKTMINIAHVKM